jgi:hypothetical protein
VWPLAALALALAFPKLAVAFGQDFYVSKFWTKK